MTLVVTGASGHLGRAVVERLLDRDPRPAAVVAVTRRPDALADLAARGAEVRHGDFDDPASLEAAFAGGERLLLVSTDALDRRVQQHATAINAAVRAGVRHVAYTSMLEPDADNPAVIAPSHRATEAALRAGGTAWTILRNSLYAEFQVPEAEQALATGELHHNRGDGRVAYVSREDCAAAAAAVLAGAGEPGEILEITGPQALDADDLAALYGDLGGRPVTSVAVADDDLEKALADAFGGDGHARYGARLVVSMGQAVRAHRFEATSDAVERLTGRPPRSLADVLDAGLSSRPASPPARP